LLKIRLARVGKKKQPSYRVVIADARAPRDGAYVEVIGYYNPRTEPMTFELDEDKARDWLRKGAQPSERMHKLLAKKGILEPPVFAAPKAKAEARAASAAPAPPPAATAAAEAAPSPAEAAADAAQEEATEA